MLLLGGTCILMALPSHAQQVYRIVGPDGKVTFSDQPPPAAGGGKVTAGTPGAGGAATSAGLPFELRQIASKYPVTLYTGDKCAPCGSARAMLMSRGIPFTEKTVNSNEDIDALQRLSGDASLPFMTIAGQQLKGYSDAEWTQFLNAAGYPANSTLPASYRNPAATPLVVVSKPAAAATPAANAAPRAPTTPAAPPPSVSNPAGIKF
ncbi:MAG: glutaredoxin family protein [Polaromonas sp.]|uniref:glutaredoxin family protein n=1 Tax=Polaromonas sp. TaxID=1869339 RepID=UPI0032660C2F